MKINIVYRQFFDMSGSSLVVGGVETYIINLIKLFVEKDYEVSVYQFANENFEKKYLGATIVGVRPHIVERELYKNSIKELVKVSYVKANIIDDILIFASDNDIIKTKYDKVVAIQHGVGWDVPFQKNQCDIRYIKAKVLDYIRPIKNCIKYRRCNRIVCVDYNFINWYRTCIRIEQMNYEVIPNFATIVDYEERKKKRNISIIFARRFQLYRGTRVFVEAITGILDKYDNVNVTVAGEGPEEGYMRQLLGNYSKVSFEKFSPLKSIEVHRKYDIAVVPSIGSEGTSLSLLEAMAAGCAVICTDIGGLTNIVINGHNGLIIKPSSKELYYAIELLINNYVLRERISRCAYETIKDSFSLEEWSKRWLKVIEEI